MRRLKRDLWPCCVPVDRPNEIDSIERWLADNLGMITQRWYCVHGIRHTDYYFRNDQDATMFALRWS